MAQELRLLVVEDSEDDVLLLMRELQRGGFDPVFERVESAAALENALASKPWDLVISDYSIPGFSGTEALKVVRDRGYDVPFVFVSGTISEEIAVDAMKAGAHDYIMKGNLKRLVPAVRRELTEAHSRRLRVQAEKQLRLRDARIRALHEINTAITSTLDLASVLDILLEKVDVLLEYSVATIGLHKKERGILEPAACRNLDLAEWKSKATQGESDPESIVLNNRAPVIISDLQTDARLRGDEFYRSHRVVSYVGIPLFANGEVVGVLGLYTRSKREFPPDEVEFLATLGGQAAMAIYNSQLYEEIKSQAAELTKANEVKADFLNVMSHEFRTPINLMIGYVQLVQEGMLGELKEEQSEALKQSLRQSKNLLRLLTDLLYASRLQAQNAHVFATRVELARLLAVLRSDFELSLPETLALRWDVPGDLPVIETDADKIKQIIHCLVDNAIKFTETGEVQVGIGLVPAQSLLRIVVTDSGIGIPRDQVPLIFDLFRQVDSSSTRSYEGAGLGLYIVKNNAALLGGEVTVVSEPGKGSTFTVMLPVRIISSESAAPR
jgi:signal transduction histidine kinase/DNA-binding response OmpR family regulator